MRGARRVARWGGNAPAFCCSSSCACVRAGSAHAGPVQPVLCRRSRVDASPGTAAPAPSPTVIVPSPAR
ncbi:hypothetical protein K523DRAFT_319377 [Schizophyllum commune Tattone D]|nr:hypothetical protein K523DRAFT_319377 [Schizophyllum commune Tattone D]